MINLPSFNQFLNEANASTNKVLFINFDIGNYSNKNVEKSPMYRGYETTGPLFVEIGDDHGLDVDYCNFNEIVINRDEIYYEDVKFSEYAFIFVGLMDGKYEQTSVIADYIELHKIPHFNYGTVDSTKISDEYKLTKSGLPTIPNIVTSNPELAAEFVKDHWNGNYPVVSKPIDGSRGDDVIKCDNQKELLDSFKTEVGNGKGKYKYQQIVQQFIPNNGDVRVLIFNDTIIASAERKTTDKKEFRNNLSLGGTAKLIKLDESTKSLALKAAKVLKKGMAGVDLIQSSSDGKWYIMEVNSGPQYHYFTEMTGDNFPETIIEFIKQKLKIK